MSKQSVIEGMIEAVKKLGGNSAHFNMLQSAPSPNIGMEVDARVEKIYFSIKHTESGYSGLVAPHDGHTGHAGWGYRITPKDKGFAIERVNL